MNNHCQDSLECSCVPVVNLSVPEEVDAQLTKELLNKYDLKAAGSLVSMLTVSATVHCAVD